MSNPGSPNPFSSLSITGNPAIDGLIFKVLVGLGFGMAAWVAHTLKITDPDEIKEIAEIAVGGLAAGAAMIWGYLQSKRSTAVAVQATLNMVQKGQALMTNGTLVAPTPPLKPVTVASAQAIVKNFTPVKAT